MRDRLAFVFKLFVKGGFYRGYDNGSISILFLLICVFAALSSQLAIVLTNREMQYTIDDIHDRQLRLLCYSAMDTVGAKQLPAGEVHLADVKLRPGNKDANIKYNSMYSPDGFTYSLDFKASIDWKRTRGLRRLDFTIPPRLVELAKTYPLIYKTDIYGTENLFGNKIYASNEEVIFPQIDLLERFARDIDNDEVLAKKGFSGVFYCIRDSTTASGFSFRGNNTYYGSTVFACRGSINIGDKSSFPGRIVFIADRGNVHIGRGVQMENVVIMATKTVNIAPECKIKGVIYADRININGNSEFFIDDTLVARMSSKRFIL